MFEYEREPYDDYDYDSTCCSCEENSKTHSKLEWAINELVNQMYVSEMMDMDSIHSAVDELASIIDPGGAYKRYCKNVDNFEEKLKLYKQAI